MSGLCKETGFTLFGFFAVLEVVRGLRSPARLAAVLVTESARASSYYSVSS